MKDLTTIATVAALAFTLGLFVGARAALAAESEPATPLADAPGAGLESPGAALRDYEIRITGELARDVDTNGVPAPTHTPTPTVEATGGYQFPAAVERWRPLVNAVGFPRPDDALAIMTCESMGDPNATGSQGERGLMQVHPAYHHDATYDPEGNLRAAYRISNGGRNWAAWTTSAVLRTGQCPHQQRRLW